MKLPRGPAKSSQGARSGSCNAATPKFLNSNQIRLKVMLHPSCHDEIMMEGERRWKAHGNTIRPRAGINSVGAFRRDAESCDRRDMLAGNEGVRSEASHVPFP